MKSPNRLHWPTRQKSGLILCAASALIMAAGCSKHSAENPATTAPVPDTNTSQSATQTPAVAANPNASPATAATNSANAAPDLRPLNQALLTWIVQNRKHPASFEEFAASAGIQIPPPPPGKKYVIDSRGLISLVNR